MDAQRYQFSCANPEKSDKTKAKMDKILEDEMKKLDFESHKSNPVPRDMLVGSV